MPASNPQPGDRLTASVPNKVRDRVIVKAGCMQGSEYDGSRSTKGTVAQIKDFGGTQFYHVLIDGRNPPGLWYTPDCLDLKQGRLKPLTPANKARCIVRHPSGYSATFALDQDEVNSYIVEGFTVTLDDSKLPA